MSFSFLCRDALIMHFIVPGSTSSNIGSSFAGLRSTLYLDEDEGEFEGICGCALCVDCGICCEYVEVEVEVEAEEEVESSATIIGDEAIARCAASADSNIASTGRCLLGELLDISY